MIIHYDSSHVTYVFSSTFTTMQLAPWYFAYMCHLSRIKGSVMCVLVNGSGSSINQDIILILIVIRLIHHNTILNGVVCYWP